MFFSFFFFSNVMSHSFTMQSFSRVSCLVISVALLDLCVRNSDNASMPPHLGAASLNANASTATVAAASAAAAATAGRLGLTLDVCAALEMPGAEWSVAHTAFVQTAERCVCV